MSRVTKALGLIILLSLMGGCATVPITGRSQLNMLSDQHVSAMADQTFSSFINSANNKDLVLTPAESPKAAEMVATVNRVSDRIITASGLRDCYNWEAVIIKSNNVNAFVLPNGKIVVFTGIIPVTKTEAGLATVVGHEVAHVFAKHGAERVSQALLVQLALSAAEIALATSSKTARYQPTISAALGIGAKYGVLLPYSREHELEADRIGLYFMAKAGYDPSEASGFWERMEATKGSGAWEYLSTHPSSETRRTELSKWMPEANQYYTQAKPMPPRLSEIRTARAEQISIKDISPVAALPSYNPGFWIRVQSSKRSSPVTQRLERKIACAAGECSVYKLDDGTVYTTTADLAMIEMRKPNGSWYKFSPPLRRIRFPLQVGDRWSDEITIEYSTGRRLTGQFNGEVVNYEAVTVPSGSFMAFKITLSLSGNHYGDMWYAPETRTFIRSILYDPRGVSIESSEVMDYQKSDEPAVALAMVTEKGEIAKALEQWSAQADDKDKWLLIYNGAGRKTFIDPESFSYLSRDRSTIRIKVNFDKSSRDLTQLKESAKKQTETSKYSRLDDMQNLISILQFGTMLKEYAVKKNSYYDAKGNLLGTSEDISDKDMVWRQIRPDSQNDSIYQWIRNQKRN